MKEIFKNKWTWIVSVLILVNIVSLSSIWLMRCSRLGMHHGMMHGHRPPHLGKIGGLEMWESKLNLSPKQRVEFDKLKSEHFKTIDSSFFKMRQLRQKLIESVGKPNAEAEKVLQMIGVQEVEMQRNMYLHFSKMYAVCDAKQRVILKEHLTNMLHHKGGRPPMMEHDMPPPPPNE